MYIYIYIYICIGDGQSSKARVFKNDCHVVTFESQNNSSSPSGGQVTKNLHCHLTCKFPLCNAYRTDCKKIKINFLYASHTDLPIEFPLCNAYRTIQTDLTCDLLLPTGGNNTNPQRGGHKLCGQRLGNVSGVRGARRRSVLARSCRAPTGLDQRHEDVF